MRPAALRDIADLLAIRYTGSCLCEPAEQLMHRRLAEVDTELARLTSLREQMTAMLAALTGELTQGECLRCPRAPGARRPRPGRR